MRMIRRGPHDDAFSHSAGRRTPFLRELRLIAWWNSSAAAGGGINVLAPVDHLAKIRISPEALAAFEAARSEDGFLVLPRQRRRTTAGGDGSHPEILKCTDGGKSTFDQSSRSRHRMATYRRQMPHLWRALKSIAFMQPDPVASRLPAVTAAAAVTEVTVGYPPKLRTFAIFGLQEETPEFPRSDSRVHGFGGSIDGNDFRAGSGKRRHVRCAEATGGRSPKKASRRILRVA